jgi:hypothetical protein
MLLATPGTNESAGEAYGFHLAWSGNHRLRVDTLTDGRVLTSLGALLLPGEVRLAPGETFASPEIVAAYSADGLSALSRKFHEHVRTKLLRPAMRAKPRPVHYNTWEAVYFDHDVAKLKELATRAADIGFGGSKRRARIVDTRSGYPALLEQFCAACIFGGGAVTFCTGRRNTGGNGCRIKGSKQLARPDSVALVDGDRRDAACAGEAQRGFPPPGDGACRGNGRWQIGAADLGNPDLRCCRRRRGCRLAARGEHCNGQH